MSTRHLHLALSVAALVAVPALPVYAAGGSAPSTSGSPTAAAIDRLNGQIVLLQGQLKIAKLKAAIKAAENGSTKSGGPVTASTPAASTAPPPPAIDNSGPSSATQSTGSVKLPTVNSVSSVGNRWRAVLYMPSGGELIVHKGTQIQHGYRVVAISVDGVEVRKKGRSAWLPFTSSSGQSSDNQGTSSSAPSYVGPPIGSSSLSQGGQGS